MSEQLAQQPDLLQHLPCTKLHSKLAALGSLNYINTPLLHPKGPSRYGTYSLLVGALDATVYPLTLEGTAHHALNHCIPTPVAEVDRP